MGAMAQVHQPLPFAVRNYGAVGNGIEKDTEAVQQAMDACAKAGGGTVYFAAGTYLCGSLHLRSHVTLYLDNGATILASKEDADFDPFEELGFEYTSLKWSETKGPQGIDFSKKLPKGTIPSNQDIMIDSGTLEHVGQGISIGDTTMTKEDILPQFMALKNIHNCMKVGGLMFYVLPHAGFWKKLRSYSYPPCWILEKTWRI